MVAISFFFEGRARQPLTCVHVETFFFLITIFAFVICCIILKQVSIDFSFSFFFIGQHFFILALTRGQ